MLGEDVTDLAREGDEAALSVLEDAGRWLGIGLTGRILGIATTGVSPGEI